MFAFLRTTIVAAAFVAAAAVPLLAQGQGQQTPTMDQNTGMTEGCPMMGQGMGGPNMMGGMGMGMMGRGMQGMMMPGMMGDGMGQGMMMGHGPMLEGRLAYLKAELGITEAQTPAWDGYVSVLKGRADAMQSMHATMMQAMQSGTAMARMDAHAKHMEAMVEGMKALRPATDALYKVLSDDQKKKADLLLGTGCCMM